MKKSPGWLSSAVFYEIYPQSFYDSNGDGIGDLPGIIEKLDYVQSLGCNAIWINPCFESPFHDAGYDVSDYYKIAPRYGTNSDMKRLFKEAHKRGMHVCLDLVPGHTSIEHPWFKASSQPEKNEFSNRYIWTDTPWYWGCDPTLKFINGFSNRHGNYMTNFFYCQAALNYGFAKPDPKEPWQLPTDHPDVKKTRQEIKNIMRFWMDMGCDGFRVDMASSLVKKDKDHKKTIELWHDVRKMFDKDYPEAILISEWSYPAQAIKAGFHVDFLLHCEAPTYTLLFCNENHRNLFFKTNGLSFFDKNGQGDAAAVAKDFLFHYNKTKKEGFISIPSSNHDTARLMMGRTPRELEVIFAFLLTMPAVPFIYYGEEIGMNYIKDLVSKEGGYNRTGSRTPMQWNNKKNAGFSTAPADKLYLPIDPAKNRPTVEAQEKDKKSLLNAVRQLVQLRKDNPALGTQGKLDFVYAKSKKCPMVYTRMLGKERFLIAINPCKCAVTADLPVTWLKKPAELTAGHGVTLTGAGKKLSLAMDKFSYGIYRLG
jgi:maltose alpha-D-glucosyltransferase/alpha-amylase